ncbi:hypothetical protein [Marinospirillum minutulum]|uniref:hypothetical protein n=1 Tax=Marinospirillum minutulum TaxID=64974 RepID=UPI0012EBE04A|nr:hypothetical protein [Marinospirillum minutulum]
MKSNKPLAYTQEPSQPTKPATLSALEPLTRSEIDALRQKKREISAYYQKVLDEHFRKEEAQGT